MSAPTPFPPQWSMPYAVTVGWMRQFRYFVRMFEKIKNVKGDVVECGLGQGSTFAMLAYLTGGEPHQRPRILWGFDSFEGWPEPATYDQSPRNPQKGDWKVEEEEVRKRLEDSKIFQEFPELEIRIVRGFFSETLPYFPDRPIAFLHADVDLYPSYRDVLTYLFPKVAEGGLVLFDEYREFPQSAPYHGAIEKWPGATKAIDDYFSSLPYQVQYYGETKKYYIVKH